MTKQCIRKTGNLNLGGGGLYDSLLSEIRIKDTDKNQMEISRSKRTQFYPKKEINSTIHVHQFPDLKCYQNVCNILQSAATKKNQGHIICIHYQLQLRFSYLLVYND